MLNKTFVAVLLASAAGLATPVLAQSYNEPNTAPVNADESRQVVAERVISDNPTVIERRVIIAKIMRMPERNRGVSKIGGTVGGAIGGYYINGTTPADNTPLDIPPDAYER